MQAENHLNEEEVEAMPQFLEHMEQNDRENLVSFAEKIADSCTLENRRQLQSKFNINDKEATQVLEWINTNQGVPSRKIEKAKEMDHEDGGDVTFETHCTSVSIQGGRSKNEDTADYSTYEDDQFGKVIFCMVADGHGGAAVSKMLKRECQPSFSKFFDEQKSGLPDSERTVEELDECMVVTLRNMNEELQGYCSNRNLSGGSTLVSVFNFLRYRRFYVLNVGDSRCLMLNTSDGSIIQSVSRIVDLEDGRDSSFPPNALHETKTHIHKVLGKIKITDRDQRERLRSLEGNTGTWDPKFVEYVRMIDDNAEGRGIREWSLFLSNSETNPNSALEFVNNRASDEELVIGTRQLPSTTRAFGDIGMTLHMGEIYVCDIPKDVETAIFVGCDGFEESIRVDHIPRYLANPRDMLRHLLSSDHKFVKMYRQYKDWFLHQRIGAFPSDGNIKSELAWLLRCVNLVGHSHLPSQRDCEVIAGACQWLQWAYSKYVDLPSDDPNNKFTRPFPETSRFRLKFLVQCALARLSFDNISGVLITFSPSK